MSRATGVVTNYDHDRPVADLDRLNFVKLAKVQSSVIITHRDSLELGELADETRNATVCTSHRWTT